LEEKEIEVFGQRYGGEFRVGDKRLTLSSEASEILFKIRSQLDQG
jgi:hypothetical protein